MKYLITDQKNNPLELALVYASDAAGVPTASWEDQADYDGYVEIPSEIGSAYLTVSFQNNKQVFTHTSLTDPIKLNVQENLLNEVVITADATPEESSFDWDKLLTYLLIISVGITIIGMTIKIIKYFRGKSKSLPG